MFTLVLTRSSEFYLRFTNSLKKPKGWFFPEFSVILQESSHSRDIFLFSATFKMVMANISTVPFVPQVKCNHHVELMLTPFPEFIKKNMIPDILHTHTHTHTHCTLFSGVRHKELHVSTNVVILSFLSNCTQAIVDVCLIQILSYYIWCNCRCWSCE
jgi:hypothetical protein